MPKLIKPYMDFRGGLNVDAAPDLVADNELVVADNVDLDERGAINKRKGTVPLNATSYAAQVERLFEWTKNDGSVILMALVGNDLCRIAEDGTKTVLKTLDAPDIGWFVFQDKFWFTGKEAGVDKFWIYDGTTVAEVTPNSATDNNLTPIKRCRFFVWHPNSMRVFAAGDPQDRAALYYSEPNDPTYFKSTNKLYPTTGDGPVYGLAIFSDAMLAFYRRSVWGWKGANPAVDATWRKVPVGKGTVQGQTIRETPGSLTFLSPGGLTAITPAVLAEETVVLLPTENLVVDLSENKVGSIVRNIQQACAVYDDRSKRYLLAYSDVQAARPDKVLVFDWELKAFTRYTGFVVNDLLVRSNGDVLVATNGYILRLGQGYKDFDVTTGGYKAIAFQVKTKQFSLDYPLHIKKLYRFLLAARQYQAETSSVRIDVTCDYKTQSLNSVSLDASFVWGEEWGKTWGYTDLITKEGRLRFKGARVQVSFSNEGLDEPLTIYAVGFEFKPRRAKGEKMSG